MNITLRQQLDEVIRRLRDVESTWVVLNEINLHRAKNVSEASEHYSQAMFTHYGGFFVPVFNALAANFYVLFNSLYGLSLSRKGGLQASRHEMFSIGGLVDRFAVEGNLDLGDVYKKHESRYEAELIIIIKLRNQVFGHKGQDYLNRHNLFTLNDSPVTQMLEEIWNIVGDLHDSVVGVQNSIYRPDRGSSSESVDTHSLVQKITQNKKIEQSFLEGRDKWYRRGTLSKLT